MKSLLLFILLSLSFNTFAQEQLVKSCVDSSGEVEVSIYKRVDINGGPILYLESEPLYRVEITVVDELIYSTDYAMFTATNNNYHASGNFLLTLNEELDAWLYVAVKGHWGEIIAPYFNNLEVSCK